MPTSTETRNFVPHKDYTFTPSGELMHAVSLAELESLLERASNRDPDARRLYIYNDFYGYAIFDLIDKSLKTIHSYVAKKSWAQSWCLLVALTELFERCDGWTQVDDGARVRATDKCYGAMLIATLNGLASQNALNEETFQDLECSLKTLAGWADCMAELTMSKYNKVVTAYGKKLFGKRTVEERAERNARIHDAYVVFYNSLSDDKKAEKGYLKPEDAKAGKVAGEEDEDDDDDEDEDDEDEKDGFWFSKGKLEDIELVSKACKLPPAWKEYKTHLTGVPKEPLRGPANWDLSKWSKAARKEFSWDE